MPVIHFPTERVFNSATFMRRHIAFTVIRNFSNLHFKNTKTCNCDNLRTFAFLLLFIFTSLKKRTMYGCNSFYAQAHYAYHH